MSSFVNRLAFIEKRLQIVFEKHAARLVPRFSSSHDLVYLLIDAMGSGIEIDRNGEIVAPNRYVLSVEPSLLRDMQDPEILEELTLILSAVTEECGLKTAAPISLRVEPQIGATRGIVSITSKVKPTPLTQTGTIKTRSTVDDDGLSDSSYLIVDGIRRFSLDLKVVNIGRLGDNHLVIDDPRIAPRHAQIRYINGNFVIFNLDTTSAITVNDVKTSQRILEPGDSISLAGIPLVYLRDMDK